jgi:hypothetical protein
MSQPKGRLVASKSSLQKLQDAVVGIVKGVVRDPVGSAGKAVHQAKGTFAVGKAVAGQVARSATAKASGPKDAPAPAPTPTPTPSAASPADPERDVVITPADVARVVEKKSPAEKAATKKAPAKKAPVKKAAASPSGKLPPRKAPADEVSAKKAPAKKAPAKKAPAKKSAGGSDS